MRVFTPTTTLLAAVVCLGLSSTASAQFPMMNLSLPVQQRGYYPQAYPGYQQNYYRPQVSCANGVCGPVQPVANCANGFCATPTMNYRPTYPTYQANYPVNPGFAGNCQLDAYGRCTNLNHSHYGQQVGSYSAGNCQLDAYGRCINANHSHYGQQVGNPQQPLTGTNPYFGTQYPGTLVPANYNQLVPSNPVNNYYLGQLR